MADTMPIIQQKAASAAETPVKLETLREQIDAVDAQILSLLNKRVTMVRRIGELKQQEGLPIYAPDREEKLLRHLVEKNNSALSAASVHAIYREIISACRALEKEVVVACLGLAAGITHQAACRRFGSTVQYAFCQEAAEVFRRVTKNEADCGVIPIATGTTEVRSSVAAQLLSDLARTELSICAEISLDSRNGGSDRFLVLNRVPTLPSGADRTLVLLRLENKPGALATLESFKEHSTSFTPLASQSSTEKNGTGDLFFLMEAEGHSTQLQASNSLLELSRYCLTVKILGSYPRQ
ncbi:Prephenate dehydratase [Candidatus Xiphinematobacter sp. Idaho Grape]|uniref:chorismate mutase n=1 Tax=Candidatus Xiphinematobacter sp. Idaho Grape TaxID=1704307 RepID=UPI00070682CF|nr:chorismate mutase [Candidatus Xiphinematobacter sp. Idaho Grape]ALJ56307.1 Prephenate dehydratase [Candidatus Xiphinematobacter sp. Idaho Grape]